MNNDDWAFELARLRAEWVELGERVAQRMAHKPIVKTDFYGVSMLIAEHHGEFVFKPTGKQSKIMRKFGNYDPDYEFGWDDCVIFFLFLFWMTGK